MGFRQYSNDAQRELQNWRAQGGGDGGGAPVLWDDGWYDARICKVQDGLIPKSGRGEMCNCDFELDNKGERKVLRVWFVYLHDNPQVEAIARRKLAQVEEAVGEREPEDWLGKRLQVRLGQPKEPVNANGYANDNEFMEAKAPRPRPAGAAPPRQPSPGPDVPADDDLPF